MTRLKADDFSAYEGFVASLLTWSMRGLLLACLAVFMLLPIVLGWHYWHLASSVLLKGLWIVGIAAVVIVLGMLCMYGLKNAKPIGSFCVVLLPTVAISTFMMWKVFGFNLLSVALPYGVVAVVLIAIKFLIYKDGEDIGKEDIAKYNGIFHIFSLGFVTLSIFPICAMKILSGIIPFSKWAKRILLSIAILCSLILACNVVASLWMFGNSIVVDDTAESKTSHLQKAKANVAIAAAPASVSSVDPHAASSRKK